MLSSRPGKVKLKGLGMKCFLNLERLCEFPILLLGVNITVQMNCEEHCGKQQC